MRKLTVMLLAALLPLTGHAQSPVNESYTTVYVNVPFGTGNTAPSHATYGIRVDRQRTEESDYQSFDMARINRAPALLDFQYRGDALPMLKLGGQNVIQYDAVSNVAGGASINWTTLAVGAATAGMIVLSQNTESDEEDPCENIVTFAVVANGVDPCADALHSNIVIDCGCPGLR